MQPSGPKIGRLSNRGNEAPARRFFAATALAARNNLDSL
jgi:hypothetical protein